MKTKTIIRVAGLMLLSITVFGQKYWKIYKPVSSDLLGYSAKYNVSTFEIAPIEKYPIRIETRIGAQSDFETFTKNVNIQILGIDYSKLRVSKITARGQIYIDRVENLIPEDVFFIYAGLRSDSVEIEFEKVTVTEPRPEEVLTTINAVGGSIDPKWTGINYVDTLNFKSTGKITMTVKNPAVYYSLQFVILDKSSLPRFKENWSLTFNKGIVNHQETIVLKPESGKFKSRDDLKTKRYWYQKNSNSTRVWLEVDKDESGTTQLYVRTSRDMPGYRGYLVKPNALGNTIWSIRGETVKTFEQKTGVFKILKVDIDARRTDDGGIEITRSLLKYPEGKLKFQ